jgi:hypothetical protein
MHAAARDERVARMRRLAPLLLVTTILLAGCGGDDGDSDGGLSREELDKQSEVICKDGREELNNLSEPNLSDPNEAAAFLTDVIGIFDTTVEKLKALEPEEDLQADYDAYLAQIESNGTELEAILDKAKAKDPSGQADLTAYLQDQERDKKTKEAAREAGLTGCAAG